MDDQASNFADETREMVSETVANPSEELRKRRSTRIVQAVPLLVTGVDALGRPFTERTSTLIINCHGCRYQSKHYVLKNMWVSLEIPHPEAGQAPRTVRGRVAWIQRPRTVRQLFQVALELELPGNVWGIAFPPEDWFGFSEGGQLPASIEPAPEMPELNAEADEIHLPLTEPEPPAVSGTPDNIRVFPTPASMTDAFLQLARQMSRLVADAKQQLQTTVREAAAQAVSAERRLSVDEWEQRFSTAREELAREIANAIEKIHQEADTRSRAAHDAAGETLQRELPALVGPQLEQLARELAARISDQSAAAQDENAKQLAAGMESLRLLTQQAEETAGRLRAHAAKTEADFTAHAGAAMRGVEDTARQLAEASGARRDELSARALEIQQQVESSLAAAQSSWQSQLRDELAMAQGRWHATVESALSTAQEGARGKLQEQTQKFLAQMQEETGRQAAVIRDSAAELGAETEKRITAMHDSLLAGTERLESSLARADEISRRLDGFSERIESTQQRALGSFESQLDDVLIIHRNELHRRSESLFEEINARIQATFEEASKLAISRFDQEIDALVEPHISRTEQAIHRLAGGRSLLDAALTLQQDRIRTSADEAFGEALARFRENLGGVDQILRESAQAITSRNLSELDAKAADLKHHAIEDLYKAAEWYEKKAQTQMQNLSDKTVEQTANQLREKAGETSSIFASELDHSSRNFVGHTQTQMEEVVRDAFERSRALFTEAAETTSAAFTDEIQLLGRQELAGFDEELNKSVEESRGQLETARAALTQRATAEQEDFLLRFRTAMSGALDAGVAEAHQKIHAGFSPLLDSWKSMIDEHEAGLRNHYRQMTGQAAEQYRNKLEGISNQWMLATVATLDHRSREAVSCVAALTEEKLRETCAQVFADVGDALREKLRQIASQFNQTQAPKARSHSAGSTQS